MGEEDSTHKAHRSGWHSMYETNMPVPMNFSVPQRVPAAAPAKKKPPPPPPRFKSPVEEFMEVTGVTDPELAAQHIAAAAQLGKSVKDAIRHYFDYGGVPMEPGYRPSADAGAYAGMVGQLVEMGFDRDLALRAAKECSTLDEAAEWCLRNGNEQQALPRRSEVQQQPYPREQPSDLYHRRQPPIVPVVAQPPPPQPPRQPQPVPTSAPPPAFTRNVPMPVPPPAYARQPPAFAAQQPPPPAYRQPSAAVPSKPTLNFDDASMALFVDTKRQEQQPRPAPSSSSSQRQQRHIRPPAASVMGGELPTPVVTATNPYGHATLQMMSMPPVGILGGAAEAEAARREASRVSMHGKLAKMSGVASGKSRFGSRWQARHFVLGDCRVAYGDLASDGGLKPNKDDDAYGAFSGTKKSFSLWGSYVVPEPPERASGRDHAFAVYRSDQDAFHSASNRAPGVSYVGGHAASSSFSRGEEREQLLLLAAEDAGSRSRWICALLAAAGRPGVMLRVGEDAAAIRLRVCYGGSPLELEAGAVGRNVLVRKVSPSSGAGAIGVKVGDELVSVNGAPVPLMQASAVRSMLEAVARPLELELRRPRDATTAKELAAKAVLSLGTDPDDEDSRRHRMKESLQVGEALRADQQAREAERAKQAAAAQAEAAALSDAVARSHAEARQKEQVTMAVRATVDAVRSSGEGDRLAQQNEHASAAAAYRAALDSLLSVKESLADPEGPARQAVAQALPELSLAQLFDHIAKSGQAQSTMAAAPPPQAPPPRDNNDLALVSQTSDLSLEDNGLRPSSSQYVQPPPADPIQQQATASALFDYVPQEDWQMAIQVGDRLLVLSEHDDGWSEVCLVDSTHSRGLVPASYIQLDGQTEHI